MLIRSAILPTALLAGCLACRAPEPRLETTAPESSISYELSHAELTLGPNDILRVGVYGQPELSPPRTTNAAVGTRVDAEGFLSLPLAGSVRVEGLTVRQAHEVVTAAYAKYLQEPRVDVSVVEFAARRFYVYGEVASPGAFPMDRPVTAYQGLAQAGPFNKAADRQSVVLIRGSGPEDLEVLEIDGEDLVRAGLIALRPDDLLFVRRSGTGRFAEDVVPILQGIGSSLSSVATVLLIEDRLDQ